MVLAGAYVEAPGYKIRGWNVLQTRRCWLATAPLLLAVLTFPEFGFGQTTREWQHTETANGAQVTIYQPQAISWPDQKTLTARAALAITPAGAKAPILGTIDVSLATTVDAASRMVHLSDPKLVSSHFPSLDTQKAAELDARVRAALPHMRITEVPLDGVLLSLKQGQTPSVEVRNDPPVIFYSDKPASLVVFDGEPVMAPVGNAGLTYAVNTNWEVFADQGTWYLLNNGAWLGAANVSGPYKPVGHLPAAFNTLPDDANFAAVRKSIPAKPAPGPVPAIFVSMKPAEIIVTDGPPKLAPVAGSALQRVTNTISTVFFDPAQKQFYVLLSGRWFSAAGLDGSWTYASDKLPPDLALLPPDEGNAAVLASVPGTAQAQEAVLRAQLPQTATLKKASAKFTATYSGPPKFEPVPGTSILYAVNTGDQILKVGEKYYACYQGAWFVSSSPAGPWVLAESIPQVIYTIPPSSPMYNVTYVQVYGTAPATVTYGYTAGYMMGFISAGVLVYGTGYYYPPVVIPGRVPIYYPYPYSYTGSAWYNPTTGAWARGGTIYGPYNTATGGRYYNPTTGGWAQAGAIYGPNGGAGAWSYYNPRTGTYSHGSAVWGGGSGTANASFYNPRYGVSGSTTQNANAYSRWGSSTISGPNKTVNTESGRNAQGAAGAFNSSTGAQGAAYHNRATGNSGAAVKGSNGDVYAGRDGNVYQHTDDGWSKWDNGGWNPVNTPNRGSNDNLGGQQQRSQDRGGQMEGSTYQQLQQDRVGRQYGNTGERFGSGGSRFGGGGEDRFNGGRFRR